MVGNLITDGTTWKWITAYTSATVVTVDSAPSWTAASVKVGGALRTLTKVAAVSISFNHIYAKSGGTSADYAPTATVDFTSGLGGSGNTANPSTITGYYQTRGDIVQGPTGWANNANRPTVQATTNTGITLIKLGNCTTVENLILDCNSLGTSTGVAATAAGCLVRNCLVKNFTSAGISLSAGDCGAEANEVTGGSTASAGGAVGTVSSNLYNNFIHDNLCPGISYSSVANVTVFGNFVTNNTGAASDGIVIGQSSVARQNTVSGNGRHGISMNGGTGVRGDICKGNLLAFNGGFGVKWSNNGVPAALNFDGNAYYSNTSGSRSQMDDAGSIVPINAVSPYANVFDVILTADPFVSKSTNDFRLNTTAGGGAACRGHGVPTSWPGNSLTTSAPDMGAAQHADTPGAGYLIPTGF